MLGRFVPLRVLPRPAVHAFNGCTVQRPGRADGLRLLHTTPTHTAAVGELERETEPRSMEKKTFLLSYEFVDRMLERRESVRPLHLQHAAAGIATSGLVLGGALLDPVDTGILVFRTHNSCACPPTHQDYMPTSSPLLVPTVQCIR
jgi:hypothetical protein